MGKSFEEMSREELVAFAERALKAGLKATALAERYATEPQPTPARKSWRQLLFGA